MFDFQQICCMAAGFSLESWKIANVFQFYKGKARNDSDNYRPISVLPVVFKIFEKSVLGQLYSYLWISIKSTVPTALLQQLKSGLIILILVS